MPCLLGVIDEFNTMISHGSAWSIVQERDSPVTPRDENSVGHTQTIKLNEWEEEREICFVDRHLGNSQMTQVTMAKTKASVKGHRMLVNHLCSFPPAVS